MNLCEIKNYTTTHKYDEIRVYFTFNQLSIITFKA